MILSCWFRVPSFIIEDCMQVRWNGTGGNLVYVEIVRKLLEFLTNKKMQPTWYTLYNFICNLNFATFEGTGYYSQIELVQITASLAILSFFIVTHISFLNAFSLSLYNSWYHLRFSIFRSLVTITSRYSVLK